MRAEPALGVSAALRAVRRKSSWAARRIDEEPMLISEGRFAGRSHLGRVAQESPGVLMVDTFSGPRRVPAGSGYSGWSAEETWWPGWVGHRLSRSHT